MISGVQKAPLVLYYNFLVKLLIEKNAESAKISNTILKNKLISVIILVDKNADSTFLFNKQKR